MRGTLLIPVALALAGCFEEEPASRPAPHAMTDSATGYFCMMNIGEHPGPKAQAFVAGRDEPVWFPSVRDLLTFRQLPGESAEILALYVSDTAAGRSYEEIDAETWIDAESAYYVVNSKVAGGMGFSEAVPFAQEGEAGRFAATYGGQVLRIGQIGPDWIFAQDGGMS